MAKAATLRLQKLGIDTYKEAVIYMRADCHVCKSEGLEAHSRILVTLGSNSIIATLNIISGDLLDYDHAGLSDYAWKLLSAKEEDIISIAHATPVKSLSFVRSKIYGNVFSSGQLAEVINDIARGQYSDIYLSSFLTACAGNRLDINEIISLTKAMIDSGDRVGWESRIVVDKHCVGGLPGNRTTPIIVSIVTAFGLTMPKTSSRAITSPAGTADTMEVLAPVNLSLEKMKKVVDAENGCIVWGGGISLSPVDDILIRVERALDLDGEGQLVASILSKKIAAGSTYVLIDIPIGPTAKVRSQQNGELLKRYLEAVGKAFDIAVKVIFTDGSQPVGRGIGPALEARDIIEVLKGDKNAAQDLRERAIILAAHIIESFSKADASSAIKLATDLLDSGKAWEKFQAICEAQGGLRKIPQAKYTHTHTAKKGGVVNSIDNRRLALVAKLAGAPVNKVAGIDLHTPIGKRVSKGEPLFTIHSHSPGELDYTLQFLNENQEIIILAD